MGFFPLITEQQLILTRDAEIDAEILKKKKKLQADSISKLLSIISLICFPIFVVFLCQNYQKAKASSDGPKIQSIF